MEKHIKKLQQELNEYPENHMLTIPRSTIEGVLNAIKKYRNQPTLSNQTTRNKLIAKSSEADVNKRKSSK